MKRIVILGGGIAGLTVAHELIERGFDVTVVEANNELGGKARSFSVPNSGINENQDLPSEHGFRFFLKWYGHLHDTLKRIPTEHQTVFENLVPVDEIQVDEFVFSFKSSNPIPIKPPVAWIKALTSCETRVSEEYESISWDSFIDQHVTNEDEKVIRFFKNTPKVTASVHCEDANVRALCYTLNRVLLTPGLDVLNNPTSDAWINHWHQHLLTKGVKFQTGTKVVGISYEDEKIKDLRLLSSKGEPLTMSADLYVSALPHEVLNNLLTVEMLRDDPSFSKLANLKSAWQVGVQYYLSDRLQLPRGHFGLSNSPWALSGIQQTDFWDASQPLMNCGDGNSNSILSLIIADWDQPGLNGKAARHSSLEEIRQEVWHQLLEFSAPAMRIEFEKACINNFAIDQGVHLTGENATNETPLFMNTVDSWSNRMTTRSAIKNLYMAGDHVQTTTYLATMESANESGRLAANAILEDTNFQGPLCALFPDILNKEPKFLKPLLRIDELLYSEGKPHFFESLPEETVQQFVDALMPVMSYDGSIISALDTLTDTFHDILSVLSKEFPDLSLSPSDFLQTDSNDEKKFVENLAKRIADWGNVNMLMVDKMPITFPSNLHAYVDIANPVFDPLLHVTKQKGSAHRVQFAMSLNQWLRVPVPRLAHLLEIGQCIHNCSLLIDDIMDNTHTRRGHDAAHLKYGVNRTLGAAYTSFFQIVLSSYIHLGKDCMVYFLEEASRAHLGQSVDVYSRDESVCLTEDEYLDMIDNKTGSFFRVLIACMVDLSESKISESIKEELLEFSKLIGLFFQIRDDYMDLESEEYAQKKGTFASDFEEGKFSFPVINCIEHHPELRETFVQAFRQPSISEEEKRKLHQLLVDYDGIQNTLTKLQELYSQVTASLHRLSDHFGKRNEGFEMWLGKMASDTPGLNSNFSIEPIERKAHHDPFDLKNISRSSLKRAIRNVISSYHIYYPSVGWSIGEFWQCFPLLLTVECMIFSVDDANENGNSKTNPTITAESLKRSKIWKMITSSRFFSADMEKILENALFYYEKESQWNSDKFLKAEEIERMNHLKSTNFRLLHLLSNSILEEGGAPASNFHTLEDYVSLLIEEMDFAADERTGIYNVVSHFLTAYPEDGLLRFGLFKEKFRNQLNINQRAIAAKWIDLIAKTNQIETTHDDIAVSFKKIYLIGREVANKCAKDESLSTFVLDGNIAWILNEFTESEESSKNLLSSDSILKKLQHDILLQLAV